MVTRDQKWVELAGIKTKMAGVLRSSLRCLPSISLRRSIVARLSSTSEKEVALQTKEEKDIVEQVTPNELVRKKIDVATILSNEAVAVGNRCR